ncbi:MAG: hypothetical protein R3F46_05910 [bacterium]
MGRLFFTALLLLCFASAALAHPTDGATPNEPHDNYGTEAFGLRPECNVNDLTFTVPFPDPASLSNPELYIIAGATDPATGKQFEPWFKDIYRLVSALNGNNGSIPGQLDESLVRSAAGNPGSVSQQWVDKFRSPLTGEFPRLDATSFSPGDVYIRPLTSYEMDHISAKHSEYDKIWNQNVRTQPGTGQTMQSELIGDVYYIRVYGWNDVLIEMICFASTS